MELSFRGYQGTRYLDYAKCSLSRLLDRTFSNPLPTYTPASFPNADNAVPRVLRRVQYELIIVRRTSRRARIIAIDAVNDDQGIEETTERNGSNETRAPILIANLG